MGDKEAVKQLEEVKGLTPEHQLIYISKETMNLKSKWSNRDQKMMEHRNLVERIYQPEADTKKIVWHTNEPANLFETARALASSYFPKFRLPMTINPEEPEKQKMNKAERLATGIFRTLDLQVAECGGTSWLYDLAYWVFLGHWAIFNWVENTADGAAFHGDIWDPLQVYPEWDSKGLVKCVRTYEMEPGEAREKAYQFQKKGLDFAYIEPEQGKKPTIIDYWERRQQGNGKPRIFNAIVFNGALAKELTLQRNLRRIPVQIGSIGSADRTTGNWQTRIGRPITALNEDEWKHQDQITNLMATILAETAYPNIIEKTRTGQEAHSAEEFGGYGTKLTYRIEDQIELLRHASTPAEVNLLMADIRKRIQEAGLPTTVYGNQPFEISGFALSQFNATMKYKIGPYINAMQGILSRMMTDFMYQYKVSRFDKITLSTGNLADIRRGLSYIEEFSPDDVPEHLYIEVIIPITSQMDKTQMILNAKQALQPPQVYSRETIWEMDDTVDDFDIEKERINQDMIEQDPFIQNLNVLLAMRNRADELRLKNDESSLKMAKALDKYIMLKEQTLISSVNPKPQNGGTQGVPPGQMPPEATGNSPDMLAAMTGQGPSGQERRPQTREERSASKTKGGVIYSASGERVM